MRARDGMLQLGQIGTRGAAKTYIRRGRDEGSGTETADARRVPTWRDIVDKAGVRLGN